ncbi:hypothetical protein C497_01025 [Halalkalicoccus jeotgali B3]|uniref:Uncharacterized protein n=1 Tax=Halalkalicoccus jeotgali (strain DSM 18796 / CECT 7217 / JCM 14584 / KCTC 4019 / B3) TaxID=795797 RepID=D8JBE9_HALJB|nr:hypothetical protein HacjB3_16221 [Halalkalicoccus jeotgali B3]ELY41301.1 hypothetical protein C497_01025 [Halalkalicoccus jeotgali B3]
MVIEDCLIVSFLSSVWRFIQDALSVFRWRVIQAGFIVQVVLISVTEF